MWGKHCQYVLLAQKQALTAGNRTIVKEKIYRVMGKTDLMKGQI